MSEIVVWHHRGIYDFESDPTYMLFEKVFSTEKTIEVTPTLLNFLEADRTQLGWDSPFVQGRLKDLYNA